MGCIRFNYLSPVISRVVDPRKSARTFSADETQMDGAADCGRKKSIKPAFNSVGVCVLQIRVNLRDRFTQMERAADRGRERNNKWVRSALINETVSRRYDADGE